MAFNFSNVGCWQDSPKDLHQKLMPYVSACIKLQNQAVSGSGTFIDSHTIVTAAHVWKGLAEHKSFFVVFPDNQGCPISAGKVDLLHQVWDNYEDIAILRIPNTIELPAHASIRFADELNSNICCFHYPRGGNGVFSCPEVIVNNEFVLKGIEYMCAQMTNGSSGAGIISFYGVTPRLLAVHSERFPCNVLYGASKRATVCLSND